MKQNSAKFLGGSAKVFVVLAWVSLVLQVGMGVFVLVVGGDPVPFGGVDINARWIGCFTILQGAVSYFLLVFIAHLIRAILEIHQRVSASS